MTRTCASCGRELERKGYESERMFLKRRFCDNSCPKRSKKPLLDRLMSFVIKTESCWNWNGSTGNGGYGLIKVDGRRVLAHRLAYKLLVKEPIMNVLHRCDNPACVRPDHLFEGTIADDVADMIEKGRAYWQKKTA